jgi:hypothetical protein
LADKGNVPVKVYFHVKRQGEKPVTNHGWPFRLSDQPGSAGAAVVAGGAHISCHVEEAVYCRCRRWVLHGLRHSAAGADSLYNWSGNATSGRNHIISYTTNQFAIYDIM